MVFILYFINKKLFYCIIYMISFEEDGQLTKVERHNYVFYFIREEGKLRTFVTAIGFAVFYFTGYE